MVSGIAVEPVTSREPGSPAAPQVRFCVRAVLTTEDFERAWTEPLFRQFVAFVEGLTTPELPTFDEIAGDLDCPPWRLRDRLRGVHVSWRGIRPRLVAAAMARLREDGTKMSEVARRLGFASGSSLRRSVGGVLELSPREQVARGRGVLESVLRRLRSRPTHERLTSVTRGQGHETDHAGADGVHTVRDVAHLDAQRHAELG